MTLENYVKIYEKYFRLSRKIAYDLLQDYHLSGDVAQEVFTEMLLKKESLDESQIKFWIILNSNRRAIDQVRRLSRRKETGMETEAVRELICEPGHMPEVTTLRREELDYMLKALQELREYNRDWYEMLMRSQNEGENYKKLARDFNIKETNLRVQVCRARKWLDDKLREFYGD